MTSAGLLCLMMLNPAAAPADTQWQRGLDLTYAGTVTEEQNRNGARFRRSHELTVRVLVLERRETWIDVAVLTMLRRSDDAVSEVVGGVTGANPRKKSVIPLTRLDLLRIHEDGTAHRLMPSGAMPLILGKETAIQALPAVPLDTYAPFEFGMFPPRSRSVGSAWALASTDPNRPAEHWLQQPAEFVNAEQCAKMTMTQQSDTWEKPQQGLIAWQRIDGVWISTHDRVVRQLHRTIVHRDGVDVAPTLKIELQCTLQSRSQIIGKSYDRCRTEIELAFTTARDTAGVLSEPQRVDVKWLEARRVRLNQYLIDTEPGTPYREAVLGVLRRLEAARRGDPVPDGPQ